MPKGAVREAVLDNGVRIVLERLPTAKSVAAGIWVNAGSRDESAGEEGFSHFLEHMLFKGTRRRTATQISREIDALGGELNAFTTRETTTYYVKVLDQHLPAGVALLTDIFHHARLDSKEIEKEKQVVLEEIRMVQDDPEDLVQELHSEQMLRGHPLGRPILGRIPTIERLDRLRLLRYRARHYHPRRTVVAVAGNFQPEEMLRLMTKQFGSFHEAGDGAGVASPERWPAQVRGGVMGRRKPLEQVHLSIGFPGLPMGHKDRYAAHALNVILGGSVSSRLFEEIREKRALSYSIYSYLATFSDSGTWTVYAATRPSEAARVVELICRELRRLRRGVPKAELARAKQHMKGSVMLGLEGTTSRMSKLAKDALFEGRHRTLEGIIADIERVSKDQIERVAHELINLSNLSASALGPISEKAIRCALA